MLLKESKYTESAHIAEELLHDKNMELERLCMIILRNVQNNVLSLSEALEAYQIDEKVYLNFVSKI